MNRSASANCQRIAIVVAMGLTVACTANAEYTQLVATDAQIISAATAFPGGGYEATNLLPSTNPRDQQAEYASRGLGAETFVDFDLGRPLSVAAFRHIQRRTPDTIAKAVLIFSDQPDFATERGRIEVAHVDKPGATTFVNFAPVTARYVRWQVSSVLPGRSPNVGGRTIEFFVVEQVDEQPRKIAISAQSLPIIERSESGPVQSWTVRVSYPYAEATQATLDVEGLDPRNIDLAFGESSFTYTIPAADTEQSLAAEVRVDDKVVAKQTLVLPKTRRLTVFLLPHSHTDIGYTAIQTDIEEKQVNNLLEGLAAARRTADYPEGSRFVWNVEVTWAVDLFRNRLSSTDSEQLIEAVKRGEVAIDGMYLNELTGLCRPEELVRLFRYATQLSEQTGVPIDSAMISDVPGYTWGTVTAMNQAGIRYFSVAPNYFDRIGNILVEWENKPFWWIGPDGTSKVLVWIPFRGYATSHIIGKLTAPFVTELCGALQERKYPYDIAYLRWAGHGDNAVPDPSICEFVRDWNANHESPRFQIASTSTAFRAFERQYGDQLPEVRGDWTPYWEDGAGSSAAETAMNRASSERLAQAETLVAMLAPKDYPAAKFATAWRNVLLYSEHTWGAHCSISRPESPFTADQWNIKQSYATTANRQSRQLLSAAAQSGAGFEPQDERSAQSYQDESFPVDVYNTNSWTRTDVVLLPHELSASGNFVVDADNRPVAAQRLANDELAILVTDLPPFSGRRYWIKRRGVHPDGPRATAEEDRVQNDRIYARLDPKNGGIVELRMADLDHNLVDSESGYAVNDYLYLIGDNLTDLQGNGPAKISVRDRGPLVASLLVESDAPGCHKLTREVRITAGGDSIELINTVDKKRLEARSYHANEGKESVNFAFPFNVPEGELRMDVPLGVIRPEFDQIPSACKNWLTVGRWADASNDQVGVTWVTLDAPLVQVGGITATLLNSQTNPQVWRKTIEPTQQLYSWAMNNHWGTNYRAYQEGPVMFRYIVTPHHGRSSDAEISRAAIGSSQPLIAFPGRGPAPSGESMLRLDTEDVLVTGLKPSDDGQAILVRLLAVSSQPQTTRLTWPTWKPSRVWISNTSEQPLEEAGDAMTIPGWGLVTVRADLP